MVGMFWARNVTRHTRGGLAAASGRGSVPAAPSARSSSPRSICARESRRLARELTRNAPLLQVRHGAVHHQLAARRDEAFEDIESPPQEDGLQPLLQSADETGRALYGGRVRIRALALRDGRGELRR
jgi:hypothetical protein